MSLSSIFSIAGSGMSAQNTRLNTISSNIANAETVSSSLDTTYRARHPVFATVFQDSLGNGDRGSLFADQDQSGAGVEVLGVVEDQSTLTPRYEPKPPGGQRRGLRLLPERQRGGGNGRHDLRQPFLPDQRRDDEHRQADDAESADPRSVTGSEPA